MMEVGGQELLRQRDKIGGCKTVGDVAITPGGKLSARKVIYPIICSKIEGDKSQEGNAPIDAKELFGKCFGLSKHWHLQNLIVPITKLGLYSFFY